MTTLLMEVRPTDWWERFERDLLRKNGFGSHLPVIGCIHVQRHAHAQQGQQEQ